MTPESPLIQTIPMTDTACSGRHNVRDEFLIPLTTNDQPLQKSGIGHARGQPGCIVAESCRDNGHWLSRKTPVIVRYPLYGFRVLNRIQFADVYGLQNRRGSCLNGSAICDG